MFLLVSQIRDCRRLWAFTGAALLVIIHQEQGYCVTNSIHLWPQQRLAMQRRQQWASRRDGHASMQE